MTSFKDRTWEQRESTLGDPAENAFRTWADGQGLAYVKYGLDRPPVDLRLINAMIRYTPDFICDGYGLVEVQGCGRDGLFKFKHDKLEALGRWAGLEYVWLWLWYQPSDECVVVPVDVIARKCYSKGGLRTDGKFDGTKPYSQVSWEELTCQN